LRHLDAGIDRAPRREDLRVFKCFLLTDADRIDRARLAIADALAALPKTPALAKTMASYGAERVKRGDPAGGAALLAPVAETFPSDAAVQADYGNTLTRVGRGAEAFAALDRAIAADPKDLRYQRTKATAAMLLRDFARARAAYDGLFRKTRAVEDEFAGLVAAYGLDPKGAAGLMTQAMAPSASSQPALVELADGFIRAGKSGAASGEAIALARRLMTAGQQVLAIPVLDRALAAQPGSQDARALMAQAYRELGCDALARPFARSP